MNDYPEIAARFARNTAKHVMTVHLDDGLYRHISFAQPEHAWSYWFDIVTWPGNLHIRGDISDSYTFNRVPDMFEFFRNPGSRINPHYWAEKLDGGRPSAKVYSEERFRQLVVEHFVEQVKYCDAPRGLGKALRADVLSLDLSNEREARDALESFQFADFQFEDLWEWDFHDWDWSFLWACHAVVWGIGQYDAAKAAESARAEAAGGAS